jgi:cell division protein FtsI (penicillin-binding protein 3)
VGHKDSSNKNSWGVVHTNYAGATVKPSVVKKKTMPDVRNMTLRDALYVLENMDVKVAAKGRGKVLMQDVIPGTAILKNQTITLLLN